MGNDREKYRPVEEAILYDEANGLCPLCNSPLSIRKKGVRKAQKDYQLAHIYPLHPNKIQFEALQGISSPTDINALSNMVALCGRCHTAYDNNFQIEEYYNLQDIKSAFQKATLVKNTISTYTLEDEIYHLIDDILNIEAEWIAPPLTNLDPQTIEGKIGDDMIPLKKREIKRQVSDYYNRIKERMKLLEQTDQLAVQQIQHEVRTYYLEMCKLNPKDKTAIFDGLTQWLQRLSQRPPEACAIIVAFFVQNCEVF